MANVETLIALLDFADADAKALVEPDAPRLVTCSELRAEVAELAGKLAAAGVSRGDRVALVVSDGPQFIPCLLALVSLGAAAAPLNPAYTRDELACGCRKLGPLSGDRVFPGRTPILAAQMVSR